MRTDSRLDDVAREHGRMISRICASYESNRELARELGQDVLLAVWKALPTYRNQSSLKTFVARIAHNRAVTHVAQQMREPDRAELSEHLPARSDLPEQLAMQADEQERLLRAVRCLPLSFRQPVTLTLEGFTPAEITDILGVPANVISIRLTRAKAMLRDLLNPSS